MSEAEYWEVPEFRDGALLERGDPTFLHGMIQAQLGSCFLLLRQHGFRPAISASHILRPGLIRIPDVAVHQGMPTMPHPDCPPYVAIKVLSADDRMTAIVGKMREYRDFGVAHAWVVDPELQALYVFDPDGLHQVLSLQIPEFGITLTPQQIFEV